MAKHSSPQGPRQRQLRVGEMIRRILSELLMQGEIHDPVLNSMSISIGEVAMSPDSTFHSDIFGNIIFKAQSWLRRKF